MTIQYRTALAALMMLLLAPCGAQAGELFVSASIGSADLDEDFDGFTVNDSSTAFRLTGGWRFNEHFSLEAGYHNFGDFEAIPGDVPGLDRARLSADGFTFGAAGSLPVSERFALTARAGAFFWNGSAKINNVTVASPDDVNPFFGAGLSFDVSESFALTADWTRYELDGVNSGVASVGLQYRFR